LFLFLTLRNKFITSLEWRNQNERELECLADTSGAWKSECMDVQIMLEDFRRPQSVVEEQGSA